MSILKTFVIVFSMAPALFIPASGSAPAVNTEPELAPPSATGANETGELICERDCPRINPEYIPSDEQTFKKILHSIATEKGLADEKIAEIEATISCESQWIHDAVGDGGTSFGLVQIHLPAHPDVAEAEALTPEYAIEFIVDEFLKGNEWKWTCWRLKFSQNEASEVAKMSIL
jgi:hypothetical protein